MKIALISSSGGHLIKTYLLKEWWAQYEHFWVIKKDTFTASLLKDEVLFFGHFPENRNFLNAIKNFFLALKLMRKNKPEVVFSAGAGIAPPFFMAAKLFGIKTIFLETFIFINRPTLSGKIIYHLKLANVFLVQNKKLLKHYPSAQFLGELQWS